MNTKKNIGLLVLLIVQAALIIYLYQPGRNAAQPAAAIFNGLRADMIKSLTITDDSAKSVHLTKVAGHWTVGENNYPADSSKIKGIMRRLSKLKKSRLVSRSRGSHSRLKVGEQMFRRKVTMTKGNGKKLTFFLGASPSSKTIYLRRAGDNDVYEVSGLTTWQLQTDNNSWWQTQYVTVNQAKLQSLTIKGKGNITLTRTTKGNWQLTGAPANSKMNSKRLGKLLDTISDIFITGYEAKDFTPPGKAAATIAYKTKNKNFKLQIWAGKDKKADTQIIKNSMSKFYAKISSYILQDTLKLKQADLLTKPKH
ncbi:MAG: DUF4340 domain-containing protein [Deltaproteobacteria bacterium]|nr:DUF4340 domain-containing protein [Deltaproteobacteria bacterium]